MRQNFIGKWALLAAFPLISISARALDRATLFQTPDFVALPPETEILSNKTTNGVEVMELTFAGAPFNGQPTRIYGFYARPAGSKKAPGVVQLHGAGLNVLNDQAAIFYAKNGFACLSIDWAGPAKDRAQPRKPPYSTFESPGNIAHEVEKGKPWESYGPEKDGITNGVRFVLRSLMFLRSQPDVDPHSLFISGMSAGAHLTLLVLGQDTSVKGAAVKYGCGFVREVPAYFGGYFGPLTITSKQEQEEWLNVLDPALDVVNYKSSVLMLSGTDDIFFKMPLVLLTYRAISSSKRLLMLPNDNHTQVNNEDVPLRWFKSVLGIVPEFPKLETPTAAKENKQLRISVKVEAPRKVSSVVFYVKTMPQGKFVFDQSAGAKWETVPAKSANGLWTASVPLPNSDEQLVAYATATDSTGTNTSSDTVEVPDYPQWRGQ